jgi:regulatory protein YycI of two-component signal transduction system YycFG
MNNFNAIVMFILIGYITYLFSKNMAIVLLVALLLTNLFMSSSNNHSGKEGFSEGVDESLEKSDAIDLSGNKLSSDISGNNVTKDPSGNNTTETSTPAPSEAPTKTSSSTKKTTQLTIPAEISTTESLKNIQNFDMDKMNNLLNKSKELMNDLKDIGLSLPGLNLPGITK